jgi:hypothetical protein
MIETIGYIATMLVLIGYALNSQQRLLAACVTWIIGDVLWVTYDVMIQNTPHTILSALIIALNIRAIYRLMRPPQDRP